MVVPALSGLADSVNCSDCGYNNVSVPSFVLVKDGKPAAKPLATVVKEITYTVSS